MELYRARTLDRNLLRFLGYVHKVAVCSSLLRPYNTSYPISPLPYRAMDEQDNIPTNTDRSVDAARITDAAAYLTRITELQARVTQLEGELLTKESVYKGLQTKYNNLQAAHTGLVEAQQTWESERATFQSQIAGFAAEKATFEGQIQALTHEKSDLAQAKGAAERRLDMVNLVSEKFPNLMPMLGTLDPKDSIEATEQMLQGMSQALTKTIEQQFAGVVPGGNFSSGTGSHQAQETPDQLLAAALNAAGTDAYNGLIERYYAALAQSNQMPHVPRPHDEASAYGVFPDA